VREFHLAEPLALSSIPFSSFFSLLALAPCFFDSSTLHWLSSSKDHALHTYQVLVEFCAIRFLRPFSLFLPLLKAPILLFGFFFASIPLLSQTSILP